MSLSTLVRREPFSALFDEVFSDFFGRAGWPVAARVGDAAARPARMDVVDKGDKYAVSVELPGVRKQDIQVSVEGARVSIAAESRNEREAKDGERVLHTERFAASYARSFELPVEVTEEGADASFEDGVLRLTLPKRAQAASRRLTVR
jgi:HSP20 family protein